MKPKAYLAKYKLLETSYFDRTEFIEDITDDFKALLGAVKLNPNTFRNCVDALEQKWWNIFNGSKVTREAAEKFWKFLFATQIVPIRNLYFPDWKSAIHEHRYATDPDYKRRHDSWRMHQEEKKWLDEMEASMEQELRERAKNVWEEINARFQAFLEMLSGMPSPEDIKTAKITLGIPNDQQLTKDLVKARYRIMAKMTHPDLGGDSSAFLALANSRDLLLRVAA